MFRIPMIKVRSPSWISRCRTFQRWRLRVTCLYGNGSGSANRVLFLKAM